MATVTVQGLRDEVRGQTITRGRPRLRRRPSRLQRDDRPAAERRRALRGHRRRRRGGRTTRARTGSPSRCAAARTACRASAPPTTRVVIDLVRMQGVEVDPARQTARAQGGATWGDFNDATHAHGLATTGGIISTTGVGGLTLGGGIGYLSRGCGLSCDNLISAEVVTADGQIVAASEHENEDLFWALRGGGGNFGVVTSLEYRLHPVERDLRRADVLRAGRRRRRAALLPRVHPGRARAARRLPGVADRAAAAVHPGGPPRRAVHRVRGLLGGTARRGRGAR